MKRRLDQILAATVLWAALIIPPLLDARATVSSNQVVNTRLGKIRGLALNFQGERVSAFLGVPYARPPIKELRFSKPEPMDPWDNVLLAQEPGKACYLTPDTMEFSGAQMWNPPNEIGEDCLNMNIWVPEKHDGSVLVWIFGGGFFSGSPSLELYNGTAVAALKHTIVVNINYRLGPFGFLYLGKDSTVTGNMGLLDQQAALRWIHENIGSFGGDPSKVTLFGESAGGASVTSHLFAPDSYSFFNKIIALSGSITQPWATQTPDEIYNISMKFAERLGCTDNGHAAVLACLRTRNASEIQAKADEAFGDVLPMTFPFVPVSADPNFFKGDVFKRLRKGNFKKDFSAILGTVEDEGTYWLPYYVADHGFSFDPSISPEDPKNAALIDESQYQQSMKLFLPYFGDSSKIEEALTKEYRTVSKRRTLKEKLRDGVGRFIGDYCFTCSLIEFADIIADYVPVYMYYFTMRSTANPWPKWMGVMHGYEIEYFFGQPIARPSLYDEKYLETEQRFSKYVLQLWSDFCTTGSPASYWPRYNKRDRKALVLSEQSSSENNNIIEDVHGQQCKLINKWKKIANKRHNMVSTLVQ